MDAFSLLRQFEGFRETPYWDVNAYRTGYGSDTVTRPDGSIVPVAPGMKVGREDAERDLQRRVNTEFMPRAVNAVGQDNWGRLTPAQQAALTSITYNYGSLPKSVAAAVASGDPNAVGQAITALGSHNDGINANRRAQEAAIYMGQPFQGGGELQGTVSTKSPGLLGQPEQPRGLLGMNPERLDRLSLALMALSGSPSLQPLMANVSGRMEDRRDERKTTEKTNATLQWLGAQPGGATYAQLANILGPEGAINAYMQDQRAGQSAGGVQSTNWLPDGSGAVTQMRDGSLVVRTAGGETLTGPQAEEFVAKANSQYTDQQRSIYGARREGALGAEIDLGGEAERVATEGKMAPQVAREYLDKAELVGSSVRNMRDAVRAIDEGAQSGVVYNMLPNVTLASAELANARQRLGIDVIGSVTFGALSEGEMQLAMDTAMPSGLGPEQLREWLTRKMAAQEKAHAALMEASLHFASGGSMADYLKKIGAGAPSAAPATGTDDPLGLR